MRRRLAEAGYGVLHTEEYQQRDWPAIDGALADAVLDIKLAEDESRHFVRGNPSIATGEALFSVIALAGGERTRRSSRGWKRPCRDCARYRTSSMARVARWAKATCRLPGAIAPFASATAASCCWPTCPVGRSQRECRFRSAASLQEAATHASAALEWFRSYLAARPAGACQSLCSRSWTARAAHSPRPLVRRAHRAVAARSAGRARTRDVAPHAMPSGETMAGRRGAHCLAASRHV